MISRINPQGNELIAVIIKIGSYEPSPLDPFLKTFHELTEKKKLGVKLSMEEKKELAKAVLEIYTNCPEWGTLKAEVKDETGTMYPYKGKMVIGKNEKMLLIEKNEAGEEILIPVEHLVDADVNEEAGMITFLAKPFV